MEPVKATTQNIIKAAKIIRNGGTVSFPTETVYGLGADGLNPVAVAKIFEIKNRPTFNPLILHICNVTQLQKICNAQNGKVKLLIENFWPGPLTLILPKTDIVPEIVTADNPTVAVRMPDNPVALELIERSETPIAAPSANLFNRLSPTKAEHVYAQLGTRVDMILDGGSTEVGVESTIVEIDGNEIFLLRPGGVTKEALEQVLKTKIIKRQNASNPNSPGQLSFHYSPTTPLKFLTEINLNDLTDKKVGGLFFSDTIVDFDFTYIAHLSRKRNFSEAAANLFSILHILDKMNLDIIVVEPLPEKGLGLAMMDRLKKAAANFI